MKFHVSLIKPTVTLYSPANGTETINNSILFTSNLTAGNYTLDNATIKVWYTNGTLFGSDTNTSIAGTTDTQATFNISNLVFGESYYWNVYLHYHNPTLGTYNTTSQAANRTFTRLPFEVTGEIYNTTSYETDNQTFEINISTIDNILSTSINLNYDGHQYFIETNCLNGMCELSKSIDIPSCIFWRNPKQNFLLAT